MSPHSIVVCAFGPNDVTRSAVVRARRLAGPLGRVIVFAANRGGRTAVSQVPASLAERADGYGMAAAAEVLASLSGPVLFVHDDMLITAECLQALAGADRGSGVVVPWSNDLGTEHYVGGLPKIRGGEDRLRSEARSLPLPAAQASRFRAGCLLGDAPVLLAMVDNDITSANTIIEDVVRPATIAGRAVAAHDGGCANRLAPPEGPDGRPLIVAALIVRDEAAMLAECLESLQGFVDRIEVCDTGSTDDTVDIARSYGANVIVRQWRDDFAWARNEVLAQCRDAWFALVVDADERLRCVDADLLRRRLATAAGDPRAYLVKVSNVEDIGGGQTGLSSSMGARIFSPSHVHYEGAIHEQPVAITGSHAPSWTLLDGIGVEHHGYRLEVFNAKNKAERNLSIAQRLYDESPSPQTAMHYARSLGTAGTDPQLQIRLYREALDDHGYFTAAARALLLTRLGEVYSYTDAFDEALTCATQALELIPGDDEALALQGTAARALGRNDLVVEAAQRRRTTVSERPVYDSEMSWAASRSREVEALLELGRFDEAFVALEEILRKKPEAFGGWGVLMDSLMAASPEQALGLCVQLAVIGGAVGCFKAIGERCAPDATAECGAAYLELGGRDQRVVHIAYAATLVAERWDLYEFMAPAAQLLEAQAVENIVARAHERGAPAPELLREAVQAGV